ncbi:UPF0223 family protein [Ligilactobacillus sp. WILCCON 0076]|uniref:UPF0223 family protein n=1 Tax=Ligilactobacillus ubinensis TaxID=2876789 RepID=A0A9X2FJI0_9LACO|nr:UPF0223 family protein [Ligilactobacillus ubinensis]MCP0886464.1 UPF0223 family protein [Ligilactobacillus ubinensis]
MAELRADVSYPLLPEWTTEEIIKVSNFYAMVEKANTSSVLKQEFINQYKDYCKVVPAIMTRKQLDRQFEEATGFSIYKTTKAIEMCPDTKFKV